MSVNKVILLGFCGKEPEVKSLDNGAKVANLTLATSERGYKTKDGKDIPERTDWHNIVFWKGLAELVEKYVHKGDKLYIEGKIRTRSYEDGNGSKKYVTEIYADSLEMLSSKNTGKETDNIDNEHVVSDNGDLPF